MSKKPIKRIIPKDASAPIPSGQEIKLAKAHQNHLAALSFFTSRLYDAAIAAYDRCIFLDPSEPSYYWHRAEAFLEVLDFDSAIANYRHFSHLTHQSRFVTFKRLAPVLYTWGQILLDQKRYRHAIEYLDRALSMGISKYHCLVRKAYALAGLHLYDEALELLYELTEMKPKEPDLYVFRIEINKHLGNVDFANMDKNRVLELAPEHPNLAAIIQWIVSVAVDLKNKASQEVLAGHVPEAIWFLNHAIELDPLDWTLFLKRGQLLAEQNNLESAIEDFLTCLNNPERDTLRDKEIQGHIARVYTRLGCAKQKRYDEAMTLFTTSLNYDPFDASVWKYRADCYFQQEEYHNVIQDLTRALDLLPQDPEACQKCAAAHYAIGFMDATAGRYNQALKTFSTAIQLDDSVAEYFFARAKCYYRFEEMDHVRRDVLYTLKLDPKHAHAQSFMAMLGTCIPLHDLEPFPSQRLLRRIPNPEDMTASFQKLQVDQEPLDTNEDEDDTLPPLPKSPRVSQNKQESVTGNAAKLVSRGTSRLSMRKDLSRPVSTVPKS